MPIIFQTKIIMQAVLKKEFKMAVCNKYDYAELQPPLIVKENFVIRSYNFRLVPAEQEHFSFLKFGGGSLWMRDPKESCFSQNKRTLVGYTKNQISWRKQF